MPIAAGEKALGKPQLPCRAEPRRWPRPRQGSTSSGWCGDGGGEKLCVCGSALCPVCYLVSSFSRRQKRVWLLVLLLEVPAVCKREKKKKTQRLVMSQQEVSRHTASPWWLGSSGPAWFWSWSHDRAKTCRRTHLVLEMQRCRVCFL